MNSRLPKVKYTVDIPSKSKLDKITFIFRS